MAAARAMSPVISTASEALSRQGEKLDGLRQDVAGQLCGKLLAEHSSEGAHQHHHSALVSIPLFGQRDALAVGGPQHGHRLEQRVRIQRPSAAHGSR